MRRSRGQLILMLGLVVGALAGLGLVLGFEPARLPPALLNIALYKLTFIASAGLLAGGAMLIRRERAKEQRPESSEQVRAR